MKSRIIGYILRTMVGAVFAIAGFEKVLDPEAFALAIKNYHLVPNIMVNVLALGIPMTELGAGICLVFGIKPRVMAWVICSLLLVFLCVISYALWRGEPMNCGCFLGDEISIATMWFSFLRNCILLAIIIIIIVIYAESKQIVITKT